MPTDIHLRQQVDLRGTFLDWLLLPDGTLSEEEELATAVRMAIATDALADLNEPLPDLDSEDRRGWWGDMDARRDLGRLAYRLEKLAAHARQDQ